MILKNYFKRTFWMVVLIAEFFSPSLYADETVVASQVDNVRNDEQIHMIALDGTPDELRQVLVNKDNINSEFKCNTLLMTVVKSASDGAYAAKSPEYAIEKAKILIKAGVDVNKGYACPGRLASPLSWAVALPQHLYEAENRLNDSLDYMMTKEDEYCDFPGIISKPCKDITPEEREEIRTFFHKAYKTMNKLWTPYFVDLVKLLVNNGANINEKNFGGRTPMHTSVVISQGETLKISEYLIEKGADINAQDDDGNTPLHVAFSVGNKDAVDLLIKSGADTKIRNNAGALYNQVAGYRTRISADEAGNISELTVN